MKRNLLSIVAILAFGFISAQQDAMYTHYAYNTLAVNPGYAGSRDALTLTALHRSQWVNFPGAPKTQTFTMHGPVLDDRLGIGISFVNDKLGPISSTAVFADFAYRMKVDRKSTLAFGLKAGINSFRGDFANIILEEDDNDVFGASEASKMKPNFGFGLYYHRERFYAGLSTPSLLENEYESVSGNGIETSFIDQQRHFYLIAGGVINVSQHLLYKPTTFLKVTPGAPIQVDFTNTFIYREKYDFGLMYRSGDAAGVLLGMMLNEQLYLGYSYDWSFLNKSFKYNGGSHEVMLRYDFVYKRRKKIKSPRYF